MNEEIIAKRVNMGGGILAVLIVGFLFGAGALVGGIFLVPLGDAMFLAVILFVFAALLLSIVAYGVVRAIKNASAGPNIIVYHPDTKEYELIPIFKKPFRIKKGELLGLTRNYFTDFVVVATYSDQGRIKKVRLGWSLDVPHALKRMEELRSEENK